MHAARGHQYPVHRYHSNQMTHLYNTRRVSSAVYSQMLRMSECVIASQALDHISFLQELQRLHACDGHQSANNAEVSPSRCRTLRCSVCLDRKSSLSLPQAVETLIRFAAFSMHSLHVIRSNRSGIDGVGTNDNQTTSKVVKVQSSMEPPAGTHHEPNKEWITRIGQLQVALTVCPNDILARSELARLLEQLGQPKRALCHWNMVLACDPNSLNGREGVARCRQRIG